MSKKQARRLSRTIHTAQLEHIEGAIFELKKKLMVWD